MTGSASSRSITPESELSGEVLPSEKIIKTDV